MTDHADNRKRAHKGGHLVSKAFYVGVAARASDARDAAHQLALAANCRIPKPLAAPTESPDGQQ